MWECSTAFDIITLSWVSFSVSVSCNNKNTEMHQRSNIESRVSTAGWSCFCTPNGFQLCNNSCGVYISWLRRFSWANYTCCHPDLFKINNIVRLRNVYLMMWCLKWQTCFTALPLIAKCCSTSHANKLWWNYHFQIHLQIASLKVAICFQF